MTYGLVIGLTIIATLAAVGYIQRRDVDTDWLIDVEPVVVPAEPRIEEGLPLHRTEAGWPNCATCEGGGCLDCTDPS